MKKRLGLVLAVASLAAMSYALTACGRGGSGAAPSPTNDWDVMLWDTGVWQ